MIIKKGKDGYQIGIFIFLILFLGLPFLIAKLVMTPKYNTSFRPHAQEAAVGGIDAIQKMIDSAKDGETITIPSGTFSGNAAVPDELNPQATCFLNLGSKKITLKGANGAILFGEGHDKPDVYAARAGICSNGGDVVIDNLRIKEFQGGGLRFTNSHLLLKNSIIEGNDSGSMHLNNTSLLAVNNFFVANIGISPKGLAPIKAYNNTFYYSKGINAECNKDLPPIDFVNNIVVDPELTIGAGWITGNCPATTAQFKSKHIVYNLIWKVDNPCYENHEYCDDFTGKINSDPLYSEPVFDQRGIAAWANFGFKEGSPAIGIGDPSIPGPKNLGNSGGPCAEPNSSICTSFIQSNIPKIYKPESTSAPVIPIVNNGNQTQNTNNSLVQQVVPTAIIRAQNSSTSSPFENTQKETGVLFVTNKSNKKMIKFIGAISNNTKSIQQEIGPGGSFKYVYTNTCDENKEINLGVLYSSSEDNYASVRYKNLVGYCEILTVLGIE